MKDPEDDERERQSGMRIKHMTGKINKTNAELISENNLLRNKIRDAMTAFNEILDDLEEFESRRELISEICRETLGILK